jgi:hypothetical protein
LLIRRLFQDAEAIARKTDNTSITKFNIYHAFFCPGSNSGRLNGHHGINGCGNHDKHSLKDLDFYKLASPLPVAHEQEYHDWKLK